VTHQELEEHLLNLASEAISDALTIPDDARAEEALRIGLQAASGYQALVELGLLDQQLKARWN
jgi:hypothetical protein